MLSQNTGIWGTHISFQIKRVIVLFAGKCQNYFKLSKSIPVDVVWVKHI